MVGSYASQSDVGGTLHFPSPTHIHHVDPAAAFCQLRRSLSKSPSKMTAFRLVTSKSTSPGPTSPLSPPRALTPTRSLSESLLSPSPANTPQQANTRRTRQSGRKLSPLRSSSKPSDGPRSPRKRTLQESCSSGNATPRSSQNSSNDQENHYERGLSPIGDPLIDFALKPNALVSQGGTLAPPRGTARFEKEHYTWSAKSSPLKRSDGTLNRDRSCSGSPSAKRRSLHGGIFGPDFDIFSQGAGSGSEADTKMTNSPCDAELSSAKEAPTPFPSRSSSLRKTTLQQRQEKPCFARQKPNPDPPLDLSSPAQSLSKARSRISCENVLPSLPRDSPFSSQGSLPSASLHPMFRPGVKLHDLQQNSQPQRHPLSRTISQSTSTSSMAEDSPTHVPFRQPEQRRHLVDFSKSLPIGANRPLDQDMQTDSQSSGFSFATPENYKLVKPLPAAFMSTGLISKRHKNTENPTSHFHVSTSTMPDTPCKRHSLADIPSPSALREQSSVKPHPVRHSFGTPSTPFNPHTSRTTPANLGQGTSIFGSSVSKGRLQRSTSFLSVDGEDDVQSPSRNNESQSSGDFDVPPTPTKHLGSSHQPFTTTKKVMAKENQEQGTSQLSSDTLPPQAQSQKTSKSISILEDNATVLEDEGSKAGGPASVDPSPRSFSSIPRSFTHSRLLRNFKSPAPLCRTSFSAPNFLAKRTQAKCSPLSPASPQSTQSFRLSPRTPKDSMIPPDPSGLSISQRGEEQVQSLNKIASSGSIFPPATPTGSRESQFFSRSRASATPSHALGPIEVDPALTSRFDKVEMIGSGEFSQVYKVGKRQEVRTVSSYFSMPLVHRSPKTPLPDRVWAVKKTRNQYIGPRDRQRKWREVETLKALGQSDHTVELIDSWEYHNRLYIQTEFCEEGSLDMFLERTGSKARLDDFRIWKILLELSLVSVTLDHNH